MAFDWIRVVTRTPDHPKVQRLEKLLGIEDGLGCAVRLWCWAADYAPEGEFSKSDGEAMARAVVGEVPSLRNAGVTPVTVALVTAGLVDDKGDRYEIHDWLEYQAAHADKAERDREQNRERQRRFRNRKRNAIGNVTSGVIDNVTVTQCNGDPPLVSSPVVSVASGGGAGGGPAPARMRSYPTRYELVAARAAAEPDLTDFPETAAVLAACREGGWTAEAPVKRTSQRAVNDAIRAVTAPVATGRLLAHVKAEAAAGRSVRPWLSFHIDTIGGAGKGVQGISAAVGMAQPAPAEAFEEGEHALHR